MEDDHPPKGGDDTVVPFLRPVGSVEKSHDAPADPDSCDDDCESLEDLIETVERGLMASERVLKNAEAMRPSPLARALHKKAYGEIKALRRKVERVRAEKSGLEARERRMLVAVNEMGFAFRKLNKTENRFVAELLGTKS